MTQKQALLAYLKSHSKGITTWVAFDALGISCVHKRISDLENDGHKIERQSVAGVNRYGNPCKVTRYRLEA
jgi:hypothetical protein